MPKISPGHPNYTGVDPKHDDGMMMMMDLRSSALVMLEAKRLAATVIGRLGNPLGHKSWLGGHILRHLQISQQRCTHSSGLLVSLGYYQELIRGQ